MSDVSPNLSLPFLLPAQAQKHVIHNEALGLLDLLVQARAEGVGVETPPATPAAGALYVLGAAPSGDWAGQGGKLAAWDGTGWQFFAPRAGMRVWDAAEKVLRIWDGTGWGLPAARTDQLDGIGIGTDHDNSNRLAVRAAATLLSHEGAGHQLKINKAAASGTASLLMQSNWTGHAEMGLAGNNDFSVKVSADGSSWTEALRIDGASGHVTGAAVQAAPTDATAGRLMRADYGYSPANAVGAVSESAGTPTGAVVERGETAQGSYTRFADGTQIAWARVQVDVTATAVQSFAFPRDFSAPPAVGFSHVTPQPHVSLEPANIRGVAGRAGSDQHWALMLKTAGTAAAPAGEAEALFLTATGRWF